MCHDAHNSSKGHLFNDGHEKDWNSVAETAIDENTDCTTVCHVRGDAQNGFDSHGHGKASNWNASPLNRPCTACHDTTKPHAPSSTTYELRYRFPDLPAAAKDNSVFGKPVQSICIQCHSGVSTHVIKTSKNGSTQVGCIDCHDQHGKNSDNNVMMIRNRNRVDGTRIGIAGATPGTENVVFLKSPRYPKGDPAVLPNDNLYYFFDNATGSGFCDQRACHGAGSLAGVPFIPMDNYVRLSGVHTGDSQQNRSNCESCHSHSESAGSFRAVSSCTSCHGQPPPPADSSSGASYPRDESLSPHLLHGAPLAGTGYGIACEKCHVYYTNSAYHNPTGGKTFQSVFFDNSVKRGASGYDNGTFTCSNIYCHSDGRGNNPRTAPTWFTGGGGQVTLGCTDCHLGSTATAYPMTSGAHTAHLADGQTCSSCHVTTVGDDNVTIVGKAVHTDNTRTVTIKGAYDNDANPANNWNPVTGTCSGITCHGSNVVNWTTDIGKISCANCHVGTGDVDDFGTGTAASMNNNVITARIDNTEWMYSGHGKDAGSYDCTANVAPNLVATSTGKNKCKFCHDDTIGHRDVANPFRLANNNWNGQGWNGNCYRCHQKTAAVGYQPPQDNATLTYALKTSASFVDNNHYNSGGGSNARHTATYNGGKFCWDCHDPHGDRSSATVGNIVMVGKRVARATDNVLGIPVGGNDNSNRPAPVFLRRTNGIDFASTDNVAPFDGICEVCHLAASGITHFYNTASSNHLTTNCIDCHGHDNGFRGAGGSNQEQFFDNSYRADNTSNYRDLSGHRIQSGTSAAGLYDGAQVNCYGCHGVAGTNRQANECLKCHMENRTSGTPTHPNGIFEWATPTAPATPLAGFTSGTIDANDTLCLACHGLAGGATGTALNAVAAPNILPTTTESWTGGSGHGATASLSTGFAGPPAYHCADCHKSTAFQPGGTARDQVPGGVHGSINRKLVRHDNVTAGGQEYPHPSDTYYNSVSLRSGRMDGYCASKCHGNLGNGQAKDDNVADHTWDLLGGGVRTAIQSHPSNMTPVPAGPFRAPDNLPLSENLSGAPPAGAGNEVCVTCHNPHGGGNLVNKLGTALTGGAKQMLRRSFSDNSSTICKECHL
jgi:predicted CxxxxCH...CXXCH cytochrome family protein